MLFTPTKRLTFTTLFFCQPTFTIIIEKFICCKDLLIKFCYSNILKAENTLASKSARSLISDIVYVD